MLKDAISFPRSRLETWNAYDINFDDNKLIIIQYKCNCIKYNKYKFRIKPWYRPSSELNRRHAITLMSNTQYFTNSIRVFILAQFLILIFFLNVITFSICNVTLIHRISYTLLNRQPQNQQCLKDLIVDQQLDHLMQLLLQAILNLMKIQL